MDKTEGCRKHMLSCRATWIVALLAASVGIVVLTIQTWQYCPIACADAKAIRRIDVQLATRSAGSIIFVVNDQATIMQILDAMRPISEDWHPAKWRKYAFLHIEFTNGTEANAEVYDVDEEVAAFSINGVYYRGGSETKLKDILESEGRKREIEGNQTNELNGIGPIVCLVSRICG